MKIKLASLLSVLVLLSACGSPEAQLLVLKGASDTSESFDDFGKALNKMFTCTFSILALESLRLPDEEIPFYEEVVSIARAKRLNGGNLLAHIGAENSEKLQDLVSIEHNKKTYKYSYKEYLNLTTKAFAHIAHTKDSDHKIWSYSNIYAVRKYDEKDKKYYDVSEKIKVTIPLIPHSEAKTNADYDSKADCI